MEKPLNIIFAGTPDFAATALNDLIQSHHNIVAVYSQPDRPKGRGRKYQASPVKALAVKHQIAVEQPLNFKTESSLATLTSYQADVMIVAAYGLLLPESVLNTPALGCINIHASLLPQWRGAAPIHRAILAGDSITGITIMQMDVGLDTGDILNHIECPIDTNDTASHLHDKLALLGGPLLLKTLTTLQHAQQHATPQNSAFSSYAKKLSKAEARIDWSQTAEQILLQIRAFNAWPVAQSMIEQHVIRIWEASALSTESTTLSPSSRPDPDTVPGRILASDKKGIVVACGEQAIIITQLQRVGSKVMTATDFLNGHAKLLEIGNCFSSGAITVPNP